MAWVGYVEPTRQATWCNGQRREQWPLSAAAWCSHRGLASLFVKSQLHLYWVHLPRFIQPAHIGGWGANTEGDTGIKKKLSRQGESNLETLLMDEMKYIFDPHFPKGAWKEAIFRNMKWWSGNKELAKPSPCFFWGTLPTAPCALMTQAPIPPENRTEDQLTSRKKKSLWAKSCETPLAGFLCPAEPRGQREMHPTLGYRPVKTQTSQVCAWRGECTYHSYLTNEETKANRD